MAYKLLTTYYVASDKRRQGELDLCLATNRDAFDWHCIFEDSPRPTFASLLAKAREVAEPEDILVIANCDIIIPRLSLELIDDHLRANEAYCLTRWELDGEWAMCVWEVGYSQDAWVFRGPPKLGIGGNYYFGVPGCDNHFSHELRAAGYDVRNPSKSIPTYHMHLSKKRTATNTEAHRVPPPYLYLTPCKLDEPQITEEALTMAERSAAFRRRRLVGRIKR